MFLGIDLSAPTVRALVVDDKGEVISRSLDDRSDLQAAAIAVRDPYTPEAADSVGKITASLRVPMAPSLTPGTAHALAEHWIGAARHAQNLVTLAVGAHVDAGIVVNGRALTGAHGAAASAGWLALNPVEREDYRRLGCLDAEVAEGGIARRLVWRIKSGDRSRALEMAGGSLAAITAAHVFDAARQGDGVAISVVRDTAKYLGMAIANLIAIVDPELVIVGGYLATAQDLLLDPSRSELSKRVSASASSLYVTPSLLGDDAIAIGAARAAMLAFDVRGPATAPLS